MRRLPWAPPLSLLLASASMALTPTASRAATPCPEAVPASPPFAAWPRIFFVTSRLADCSRLPARLTSLRSSGPYFGQAEATGRRMRLLLESRADWQSAFEQRLQTTPGRRAILYVHGFNNSASLPLERARAVAIATGFEGPVVALLWPTTGSALGYSPDEANAEWTTSHFRWLLAYAALKADRLTVISHSMGNRITLDPVRDLARTDPQLAAKIDHFIIASADVDRMALARDLGQNFGQLPGKLTIYASTVDWALWTSTRIHAHPRGGYLGTKLVAGIFPVRAPNAVLVDTSNASHTIDAHADFLLSPQGGADLCRLLRGDDVAPGRVPVAGMDQTFRLLRRPPSDDCAQRAAAAIRWLRN